MRISVKYNGSQVVNNLQNKEAQAVAQVQEVVSEAVISVLQETQEVMPVKTGALQQSGRTAVDHENYQVIGSIGFGDSSTNPKTGRTTASYAVEKHEDPVNGKFLENSLYNAAETFTEDLAAALQKIF